MRLGFTIQEAYGILLVGLALLAAAGTFYANNFNGHLCVHFPISMEKAQSIGPYATSHQEAINEGWAATQKLKY